MVAALNSGLNPSSLQTAVTSGATGLTTSLPVNSTSGAAMSSAAQQLFIMQPNNGQQQQAIAGNHQLAPTSLARSSMSPSAISNASSCSPTTNLLNSTASSLGSNLQQVGQTGSSAASGSSSAFANNSALAALAYYYPAYHHLANSSQLATSSVPL